MMKIHYLTGIGALFAVAVHIMFRVIMPFDKSLQYQNVIANYHNIPPYRYLALSQYVALMAYE